MSELMIPIPFRELMTWVTTEYQRDGSVFGVHKPYKAGVKKLPIFGETIETPFGPAAGPNTQLAQNIIAGYFGGGVAASGAAEELNRLIEKADIPATYTLMAAGVVGYDNPHSLGLLGMHGTYAANRAVSKADLVVALGARFSDRVALNPASFAKKRKVRQ